PAIPYVHFSLNLDSASLSRFFTVFFLYHRDDQDLHSFPTRRSSDLAITAGYQAALMVPTEILATQHFKKIDELLRPLGVRVALLTGNTKTLERREIYRELTDGTINVVIGTHALIQDSVIFKKLGLVIIDEQHR